jgi:hypothetical protein
MINWFKNWYSPKLDSPDFGFIGEWGEYQYSYIIFISDELKKSVGDKHNDLLFSCIKSLEFHSRLVNKGLAVIEVKEVNNKVEYKKRTLIIDDYILFLTEPDFLLVDSLFLYSSINRVFNVNCLKFDHSNALKFKFNEKSYGEYEKIAGKEVADRIFFKTEDRMFNSLQYDSKFVYGEKIYEKVPLVNAGCCSPLFNALNVYDSEDFLYLNNSVKVEAIL